MANDRNAAPVGSGIGSGVGTGTDPGSARRRRMNEISPDTPESRTSSDGDRFHASGASHSSIKAFSEILKPTNNLKPVSTNISPNAPPEHLKVIEDWKETVEVNRYAADLVIEKLGRRVTACNFVISILAKIIVIIGMLQTSGASTSSTSTTTDRTRLVLGIVAAIIGTCQSFIGDIMTIFGWTKRVNDLSVFREKLDNFYGSIILFTTEEDLDDELFREKCTAFIQTNSKVFLELMQNSPYMTETEFETGERRFMTKPASQHINMF